MILLGCLFGKHGRMVMCSVLAFVLNFYKTKSLMKQWNNYNRFLILQLKP